MSSGLIFPRSDPGRRVVRAAELLQGVKHEVKAPRATLLDHRGEPIPSDNIRNTRGHLNENPSVRRSASPPHQNRDGGQAHAQHLNASSSQHLSDVTSSTSSPRRQTLVNSTVRTRTANQVQPGLPYAGVPSGNAKVVEIVPAGPTRGTTGSSVVSKTSSKPCTYGGGDDNHERYRKSWAASQTKIQNLQGRGVGACIGGGGDQGRGRGSSAVDGSANPGLGLDELEQADVAGMPVTFGDDHLHDTCVTGSRRAPMPASIAEKYGRSRVCPDGIHDGYGELLDSPRGVHKKLNTAYPRHLIESREVLSPGAGTNKGRLLVGPNETGGAMFRDTVGSGTSPHLVDRRHWLEHVESSGTRQAGTLENDPDGPTPWAQGMRSSEVLLNHQWPEQDTNQHVVKPLGKNLRPGEVVVGVRVEKGAGGGSGLISAPQPQAGDVALPEAAVYRNLFKARDGSSMNFVQTYTAAGSSQAPHTISSEIGSGRREVLL